MVVIKTQVSQACCLKKISWRQD